ASGGCRISSRAICSTRHLRIETRARPGRTRAANEPATNSGMTKPHIIALALAVLALARSAVAQPAAASSNAPPVTPPPASFFELVREADREAARGFYKKFIDVKGMPVVAAEV